MKKGKEENNSGKVEFEDPYKSEGERQIARLLTRHGIKYHYEYPMAVIDRGKTRIWYPDFTLPEYGILLEYFGINRNDSYREIVEHKKEIFEEAGFSTIYLDENSFKGHWPEKILGKIEGVLEERLRKFEKSKESRKLIP